MRRRPFVFALVACLLAGVVVVPTAGAQAPGPVTVETPGGGVTIIADRLEQPGPNLVVATGNVELTRGTTRLLADRVDINRDSGDAVAVGRVIFYDGEDRLTAERIDYNFKTGTGVVYRGQARSAPYYRIAGERMERLDESHYLIRRGIFTTCEDDPPAWAFGFGYADADLDGIIYGTNASFLVKGIPLLPWFPILGATVRRDRQTGFLFPAYGSSSRKGYYIEAPFFWAISDSQDLTLTLDYYSSRGMGLTAEYRYIISPSASGSIRAFGIHEWDVADNQQNTPGAANPGSVSTSAGLRKPADRGWWGIQHSWNIGHGLFFKTDINGVSDDLVLREYADNLYDRSRPSVQSNVFLTWTRPESNLVANLFWYQDLTTLRATELSRLPDLRHIVTRQPVPFLRDIPGLGRLTFELSSQFTNFVRQVGSEGTRLDLFPRLTLPIPVAGLFTVSPYVAPRMTAYSKTVTGTHVSPDGTIIELTKDEPIVRRSVDIGADFEMRASRVYGLGGFANIDAVLHSIEPRATYTYRVGENLDPSKLPQWLDDNTPAASNVAFSVVNRLRARSVAPEGTEPFRWELARFTLSSGYDFKAGSKPLSPITAELILDPARYFRFRADSTYGVYSGQGLQEATTDFAFFLPQFAMSVGTRYTQPSNNFLQASARADITPYISANFTTNWDIKANTFVENRFGVDIRFQCWAFDFAYVTRAKEQGLSSREDEVRFAFYLLGVGGPFGLGQRLSAFGR